MKRIIVLLTVFSFGVFTLQSCMEDPNGTDSFKRSMEDGKFRKKQQENQGDSISDYEKNYPGDSI